MDNLKEILEKAKSAFGAKDYQTAFEIWKSLAEQRNAEAQFNLGRMYSYGRGVKQNNKKAVKWYQLAGEQGNAEAQINLDLLLKETENTEAQNNLDLLLEKKDFWKRVKGIFGQSN